MTIEREYVPTPKAREELESEIENLNERVAELKGQLSELSTESKREAARELLDLCCTDDDPDEAFAGALQLLMRAADVRDDYDDNNVHASVAVRVLVEKFGVENIRDWIRQVAKSR